MPGGLPHSEIPGSPIARISPGLFAACHVLHRLSVPRHPPDALTLRLIPGGNSKGSTPGYRRTKPPRTGAAPRSREPCQSPGRPHMKTLLGQRPASLRAPAPVRLGHMTNSLFTLQSTHAPPAVRPGQTDLLPNSLRTPGVRCAPRSACRAGALRRCGEAPGSAMVEVNGIEPMTSCLQSRRSPN